MEKNEKNCLVDNEKYFANEGRLLRELDTTIRGHIKHDYPKASDNDFICNKHLLKYQLEMVNQLIRDDEHRNQKIDRKLTKTIRDNDYQIQDINEALNHSETFGQRVADQVARFGGSWSFILAFIIFLLSWMTINVLHLFGAHFDPYPFILLNLALSCISAVQAPIIMMSQNRSSHRDRLGADNDYHVNIKSENELRILHAKLDQLNQNQIPHSFEIEKLQLEILGEIRNELDIIHNERVELLAEEKRQNELIKNKH
ncbi:DUF1003 domain-containing protein (plasmid) [Nicoliella spurrieriana]|uniref:DUF1003 domain-containing protein n=1 Tax=Nicoliella spurrieriana TaxID=2925830 RepID=A0A976RQJ2_9LACO|nr:DUF1003 domain-containing protein [Nicoliella spurrieriana]UQS86067.1 DUF1003 domain-containing protein [Nicoliella spurrieriana]